MTVDPYNKGTMHQWHPAVLASDARLDALEARLAAAEARIRQLEHGTVPHAAERRVEKITFDARTV